MQHENAMTDHTNITASDEFKDAVAKVVAAEVASAIAALKEGNPVGNDMKALFSELAVQMANVADQGNHKLKVPPETMAKWERARARCLDLVEEAHANGDKPEYKLIGPVYLNERLVQPFVRDQTTGLSFNREIVWTGVPSLSMQPINPVAEKIFAAFKESIGSSLALGRVTGPHGASVQVDGRAYKVTPGGLTVKGDEPMNAATAAKHPFADRLEAKGDAATHDNNDPNSEFVHILGTVAAPLRRSAGGGRRPRAATTT
jgi:hypothetical protein